MSVIESEAFKSTSLYIESCSCLAFKSTDLCIEYMSYLTGQKRLSFASADGDTQQDAQSPPPEGVDSAYAETLHYSDEDEGYAPPYPCLKLSSDSVQSAQQICRDICGVSGGTPYVGIRRGICKDVCVGRPVNLSVGIL